MQIPITYQLPVSANPVPNYIVFGAAVPAGCSGTPANPGASPGNLCIFEDVAAINASSQTTFDPSSGSTGTGNAGKIGAGVQATSSAAGDFRVRGTWALTAP
jgi:hypothetical protein